MKTKTLFIGDVRNKDTFLEAMEKLGDIQLATMTPGLIDLAPGELEQVCKRLNVRNVVWDNMVPPPILERIALTANNAVANANWTEGDPVHWAAFIEHPDEIGKLAVVGRLAAPRG